MVKITGAVRFSETDLLGIVYHANYLQWLEMGRIAYLKNCGIELTELLAAGIFFPITEVELHYRESCRYGDTYTVLTRLSALSRAKMDFSYQVLRSSDGAAAVTGSTRNVFTSPGGRVSRLADCYYQKLLTAFRNEAQAHD